MSAAGVAGLAGGGEGIDELPMGVLVVAVHLDEAASQRRGSEVVAYKPVKIENYKATPGTKGIVPPAERRRARSKAGPSGEPAGGAKENATKPGGKNG